MFPAASRRPLSPAVASPLQKLKPVPACPPPVCRPARRPPAREGVGRGKSCEAGCTQGAAVRPAQTCSVFFGTRMSARSAASQRLKTSSAARRTCRSPSGRCSWSSAMAELEAPTEHPGRQNCFLKTESVNSSNSKDEYSSEDRVKPRRCCCCCCDVIKALWGRSPSASRCQKWEKTGKLLLCRDLAPWAP